MRVDVVDGIAQEPGEAVNVTGVKVELVALADQDLWAGTASPPPSRSTACAPCAPRKPSTSTTMTTATTSEANADRSVRLPDAVDGQPGDRRGPLGTERSNSSPARREGVVVQQAAGGGPGGFVVHRLRGAVPSDGWEAEITGDLLGGPAHEVARLLAKPDVVAGHPAFEVGLSAGGDGQVLTLEPVQEIDRRPQMLSRDRELVVRDVLAAAATAKLAQEVPSRLPVRDLPSLGRRRGPRDGPGNRCRCQKSALCQEPGGHGSRGSPECARPWWGPAGRGRSSGGRGTRCVGKRPWRGDCPRAPPG